MITNISSIMIFVNDPQKSLSFWVEKLDFKIIKDMKLDSKIHWIQLAPSDSNVTSIILYPKSLISVKESKPIPVVIFETNDIEMTSKQLKNKGVIFSHGPLKSDLGKYMMFQDNEGNEYLVMERIEKK
jgi:lactoylglutathione lyase